MNKKIVNDVGQSKLCSVEIHVGSFPSCSRRDRSRASNTICKRKHRSLDSSERDCAAKRKNPAVLSDPSFTTTTQLPQNRFLPPPTPCDLDGLDGGVMKLENDTGAFIRKALDQYFEEFDKIRRRQWSMQYWPSKF